MPGKIQASTWILRQHFEGFPKLSDFEIKQEELPELKDGGKKTFAPIVTDGTEEIRLTQFK